MSELIGLSGGSLAGYAYLPQISHLIGQKCSAGISRRAFTLWFVASILMTIHAVLLPALVFIVLGMVCPFHALDPARDSLSHRPDREPHGKRR